MMASGRGWVVAGALLLPVLRFPSAVKAQQCKEEWLVNSTTTASELSAALLAECEGETVEVDWIGHVIVEDAIHVTSGTSVTVSGNSAGAAAVDGNGSTPLFTVESATLNIENMILENGFRNGSHGGGAILAIDNSMLSVTGTTVFRDNTCASDELTSDGGGAIHVRLSRLTWSGNTTFLNNTASEHDGGGLNCFDSSCNGTGATTFEANWARGGGGALRLTNTNFSCDGETAFVDNETPGSFGGAMFAADNTRAIFSHETTATGNSAENGGAFCIAGSSFIKTNLTFRGETTISNNSAVGDGGGTWVSQGCEVFFYGNVTFADNVAGDDGGALAIDGDSLLTIGGDMSFLGNSAGSKGGAVYANANIKGLTYVGAVFESNSAAIGGAIASYSTEDSELSNYTGCTFSNNNATSTGGAIEISVGEEHINNCTFVNNLAGSGGALRLSGKVSIKNLLFEGNMASSLGMVGGAPTAGPAVSNLGSIEMSDVTFVDNIFFCREGTFQDYKDPDEDSTRFATVCAGCNDSSAGACINCHVDGDGTVPAGCSDSPDGTEDTPGATLETLKIRHGWYRATNKTTNIFRCYNEDACLGGQTGKENFCADGYTGHYCAVCEPSFSPTLGSTCSPCSGSRYDVVLSVAIVLFAMVVCMLIMGFQHLMSRRCQDSWFCRIGLCHCCDSNGNEPRRGSFLASFKIVIVVWQIVTQFSDVANVAWPATFESFLQFAGLSNLDFGFMLSAGCVWPGMDFHSRLLLVTLWPIVVLALLWASHRCAQAKIGKTPLEGETPQRTGTEAAESEPATTPANEQARRRVRSNHMSAGLLLTFLVYSTVSSMIFQTFACDDELDDGGDYLRADYRIQCTSTEHRLFMAYSFLMIFVYPLGIPYVYARLLYNAHPTLVRPPGNVSAPGDSRGAPETNLDSNSSGGGDGSGNGTGDGSSGAADGAMPPQWLELRCLWDPYTCACWYYEVIECVRRIMLTGVVVFIHPGDAAQIAWTIVIAFVFFMVSLRMSPYKKSGLDTWLSRSGHIIVLTAFYIALIGKVDVAGEREASQAGLGVMLIILHISLLFVLVANSIWFWLAETGDDRNQENAAQEAVGHESTCCERPNRVCLKKWAGKLRDNFRSCCTTVLHACLVCNVRPCCCTEI